MMTDSVSGSVTGAYAAGQGDRAARFGIGQLVRHVLFDFRGVVFDIDPQFSDTEEWLLAIPEAVRPEKDQPFYHLLAENGDICYVAYASEGNLCPDDTGMPLRHPQAELIFERFENGRYLLKSRLAN
ncbi:MAG: heat shock protein HspQ [Asticcacaulis sp.]|jgi:heat shock protein HspQ|uniref:heat shock protein HspQ n=1 Tax=Asticcacaulis sp. TaxID=1872648 RepID=UPI0025BBE2A2|nr:heat shock protein HspQ [Asticcacaulis sp.]MCA1933921.1 heat shock protein HspQ [Asticcacaulis sp.]